jgi:hypothetical protein
MRLRLGMTIEMCNSMLNDERPDWHKELLEAYFWLSVEQLQLWKLRDKELGACNIPALVLCPQPCLTYFESDSS